MQEKGRVAVGKIAIRDKERLCAVRPLEGSLVLETLHYADEILVAMETPEPAVELSEREMGMAFMLIDLTSEGFEPEKYRDQYRSAMVEIVESNIRGLEVVEVAKPAAAKVIDLIAALKASLEAAKKRKEGEGIIKAGGRDRRAAAG